MECGFSNDLIVGVSGASGAPYAANFLRAAFGAGLRLHVIITRRALGVIEAEMGASFGAAADFDIAAFCGTPEMKNSRRIHLYAPDDMMAPPASGTFRARGMAVVPCSMRTLGALASGCCDNLLLRAADCQLKEGRKLVLVARETPLNLIHLENMTRLARAGATILPAMPAYYYHPASLADHENFLTSKICDQLGIEPPAPVRWRPEPSTP
ncbi:MAG: UbiX family flavin prenyltransferase [Candidatus Sumerlaeota bacterium]|nr:UbiX family flavin prenyltransferase [Candidatus Sumerlaeota bacterium]